MKSTGGALRREEQIGLETEIVIGI